MDSEKNQPINSLVEVIWNENSNFNNQHNIDLAKNDLRVAAYCRVSTNLDNQIDSFEMQERYYSTLIRSKPGWRLAGIYSDQGISGTQKKNRTGFQRMMRHCEEGKIDRILCKSISRFARNTVDMLDTIRILKYYQISVIFEKENIDTLSMQSEFIISTIAAIAQEESRSISENMQWSFKKRFESGEPVFKRLLGYNMYRENGKKVLSINNEEAEIVREIYQLALEGFGYTDISRKLIMLKRKTLKGDYEWSIDLIKGILTNERYTGDVICQKTYTVNYLKHMKKRNNGEVSQYLIENHHDAIITRDTFMKVQEFLELNKSHKISQMTYPLSSRLICGSCGAKLHRYNPKSYPKWRCSKNNKSVLLCSMETTFESFIESAVKKAFLEKYNPMKQNYIDKLIAKLNQMQNYDNVERDRIILKRQINQAFKNELKDNKENETVSLSIRTGFEQKLIEKEELWMLLEEDRYYRQNTIQWLENLPNGKAKKQTFLHELNIEYLRAWVISMKILSPISFSLKWSDETETEVIMDEPEGDHRRKDWKQ
ncbi:MAG: recombinase family protein [Eubacteriales bacterium]